MREPVEFSRRAHMCERKYEHALMAAQCRRSGLASGGSRGDQQQDQSDGGNKRSDKEMSRLDGSNAFHDRPPVIIIALPIALEKDNSGQIQAYRGPPERCRGVLLN